MNDTVLELAPFKIKPTSAESDLLAASDTFQKAFLDKQDGFIRRDFVRKDDGTFVDVILWQSRAHADAVFEQAKSSDAAGAYFSHIHVDPENADPRVELCTVLRSFAR